MAYVEVPDLIYKGAKLFSFVEDAPGTPPPVVVTPPVVVAAPVPSVLNGKSPINTNLVWTNGNRIHSVKPLTPAIYWAIAFTPLSNSTARFVGAEDGGGPIMREYVIYRVDTGAILGTSPRPLSTVQSRLAIDRPADPKYFEVAVQKGVAYVMAITNASLQPSAMFMDLFLA